MHIYVQNTFHTHIPFFNFKLLNNWRRQTTRQILLLPISCRCKFVSFLSSLFHSINFWTLKSKKYWIFCLFGYVAVIYLMLNFSGVWVLLVINEVAFNVCKNSRWMLWAVLFSWFFWGFKKVGCFVFCGMLSQICLLSGHIYLLEFRVFTVILCRYLFEAGLALLCHFKAGSSSSSSSKSTFLVSLAL